MVKEIVKKAKEAQMKYENFTQDQVDYIFYEAAKAANDARIILAKLAVSETGMGIVEDKIIKNHFASEIIHSRYRDLQTVGTFFKDEALGIEKIYAPMGVVGAVIPTTNPTSTAIFKCLLALKTRNAIVISPHPRAWNSTIEAAKIILNAAIAAGAPENIISWLPKGLPLDATTELMKEVDVILATGGSGLVKAAYSSGTPAIGVGAGNCPAIVDESANIPRAVASIIQSNTFDNGVVCCTENAVIVIASIYDKFIQECARQGVYIIDKQTEITKVEKGMFKDGKIGLLNASIVGQSPQKLGELFKIEVPNWAKVLFVVAKGYTEKDALAHEKLTTLVSLYKASTFVEAIEIQKELLLLGPGHTASIFIDENKFPERLSIFKNSISTGRLLVNTPSSLGAIGDLYNFGLTPTLTIGCGTWGGNIFSENIGPTHLLNIKTLALRRENMLLFKVPPTIFFKFGSSDVINNLKDDNITKVMFVSDNIIWSLHGSKFTQMIEKQKIRFEVFTDIEPNPSLGTCIKGAKILENFKPDVIIAIGGGSVMDAAKIMWLYYEHPEVNFHDLSLRFTNIAKRIVKFPSMGKLAKLICIPTTAGTGSEVTPFAVITDEKTHIKYPLADYAITPNMAIIDASLMMQMPKNLTAATGLDAITHNIETCASILANEFTTPLAHKSLELLWEYLPIAYNEGSINPQARQYVANAATMAGMAFANSFLGIVHSLSHKIGGHLGVIHGLANAIYLPHVIYFNSQTGVCEKQAYFSQYEVPNSINRYVEIANLLKIKGTNDLDKIDNLIIAIRKLTTTLKCPISTKEFGVKDDELLNILDVMSEEAFDDQCTGANPRIPLIEDLKRIYINAHFDVKIPSLSKPNKNEYETYNFLYKKYFATK